MPSPVPATGSAFSPSRLSGVAERLHVHSMHPDLPPCEYVEADFGPVVAIVEDLGRDDRGRRRREGAILHAGAMLDMGPVLDAGVARGFGGAAPALLDARTVRRIRAWAAAHGVEHP